MASLLPNVLATIILWMNQVGNYDTSHFSCSLPTDLKQIHPNDHFNQTPKQCKLPPGPRRTPWKDLCFWSTSTSYLHDVCALLQGKSIPSAQNNVLSHELVLGDLFRGIDPYYYSRMGSCSRDSLPWIYQRNKNATWCCKGSTTRQSMLLYKKNLPSIRVNFIHN